MWKRWGFFHKIMLMFILLLTSITTLYSYTYQVSVDTMENQLNEAQLSQLSVIADQLDTNVKQLASMLLILKEDPDLRSYQRLYFESELLDYDYYTLLGRIQDKLILQSNSSSWENSVSFYSPVLNTMLSSSSHPRFMYSNASLSQLYRWEVEATEQSGRTRYHFRYRMAHPVELKEESDLIFLLEAQFTEANIRKLLDSIQKDGRNDPFLYHPQHGIIYGSGSHEAAIHQLQESLQVLDTGSSGKLHVSIEGHKHLVTYVPSKELGWLLVDYTAVENVLTPVNKSRSSFLLSTSVLFGLSIAAAYLLYTQVVIPIKTLMNGTQRLELGDYRHRIQPGPSGKEFRVLFSRFNRMAERIQALIENVYEEKIRVREATVKQLQSQINPHFLYNCLAFMNSMAKMEDYKSIEAMSYHLRQYYRYGTQVQNQNIPLEEEIKSIRNYLEIQSMRMNRLEYTIDLPEELLEIVVPRFIVQPLVENAVIHGIEAKKDATLITVTGRREGNQIIILVEDDGKGMTAEQREALEARLEEALGEDMGCGVWNVHQRLKFSFGADSGLYFGESKWGGVSASIVLSLEDDKPKSG
ncbi:sensor histidine kinase [Paenibacillus sp. F411]|uniref:sensor histidine kinase n=1 Tax=Paenibacillus sp. F411 TaxID=2820239 RepID=UPI001AAE5141|nr:sensor histidine kinase [Paenibacillus sp. F411]MBO2942403.1 sensor histidine kinase [Paenibacillus sp. F411]